MAISRPPSCTGSKTTSMTPLPVMWTPAWPSSMLLVIRATNAATFECSFYRRKGDPKEAVASITKAIEIFTDMGRFNIAAKHHMTVAEIYEVDAVDIEKAITHYEQAA